MSFMFDIISFHGYPIRREPSNSGTSLLALLAM
jgi:hypothetical protein